MVALRRRWRRGDVQYRFVARAFARSGASTACRAVGPWLRLLSTRLSALFFARIMLKRRKTQSRVYVILGTIARGKALWPRIDRCGRKIPDLTAVFSTTACAGRLPLLGAISFTPLISRVDCLDARVAITSDTGLLTHHETTTTPLRARYHRFTITNHYVRSLFPPRSQRHRRRRGR